MNTNPRFSVQPMAGKQLPARWSAMAPQRAKDAEATYLKSIENAWKATDINGSGCGNIMRDARLSRPRWEDILGQK